MPNINATTPQLKLVKDLVDAYFTLDINNIVPLISKNYTYQTFPKVPDLPLAPKGDHLDKFGKLLSLMKAMDAHFYEVIEAPGKVVLQGSGWFQTPDDNRIDYDSVIILTLVEEDGELKVSEFKDFSDPEKRAKLYGWVAEALAKVA